MDISLFGQYNLLIYDALFFEFVDNKCDYYACVIGLLEPN